MRSDNVSVRHVYPTCAVALEPVKTLDRWLAACFNGVWRRNGAIILQNHDQAGSAQKSPMTLQHLREWAGKSTAAPPRRVWH